MCQMCSAMRNIGLHSHMTMPGANRYQQMQRGQNGQQNRQQSGQMQDIMAQAEARFAGIRSKAQAEGSETERHEAAHQSSGRHLAGGINLNYRTVSVQMPDGSSRNVTYAAEGSVPLAMPSVPKNVPKTEAGRQRLQQVFEDFQIAKEAAEAPGHGLSGADVAIASRASAGIGEVGSLMANLDSVISNIGKNQGAIAFGANGNAPGPQGNAGPQGGQTGGSPNGEQTTARRFSAIA